MQKFEELIKRDCSIKLTNIISIHVGIKEMRFTGFEVLHCATSM